MHELSWTNAVEKRHRSTDWFWAVGIITIVGSGVAFFIGNSLFGVFLLLGGICLFYFNLRHEHDQIIEITEKIISINGLEYPTKKLKSFCITKSHDETDILIIRTDRFFMPLLVIKIAPQIDLSDLQAALSVRVKEEELHEPPATAVAEKFGL